MRLDEATYSELRRGVDQKTRSRTAPLKTRIEGYKNGQIIFKTRSGTNPKKWWTQKVRLMDLPYILEDEELTHYDAVKLALQGDIRVTCNRPAHLYWGSAYRLEKLGAEEELKNIDPPEHNTIINTLLCKHLDTVLFTLPFNVRKIVSVMEAAGAFNKK